MSTKPRVHYSQPIAYNQIPPDIADLQQWVVWKYVTTDKGIKKVPFQIDATAASTNNPSTWSDLETVLEVYQQHIKKLAGIGFVFHESDPFVGVDLDCCLDKDGEVMDWAKDIVRRFGDTYGEVSPSGTGLKFWVRGKIESAMKFAYKEGQIEVYSSGRYFTFTGKKWKYSGFEIHESQELLNYIKSIHPNINSKGFVLPERIRLGTQHNTLVGYVCSLWAKNISPSEIEHIVMAEINRFETPPSEEDVQEIIRWATTTKPPGRSPEFQAKVDRKIAGTNGAAYLNGVDHQPVDHAHTDVNPAEATPEPDEEPEQPIHYVAWPESLKPAAFHGVIGDLCKIIEPHTESDIAAVLFQSLIMIGNMLGRCSAHFVAEGTAHFCNEFICIVGATAKGRKGSSFGQVRRVLGRVDDEWNKKRIKSGLTSGEGLIFHVRDEMREIKQSKGKMEEVVTDPGERDKRLLIVEEEFSSALKSMSREGNTLSGVMRQAWDSPLVLAPMTKNNRITASHPHVSIIAHITKDELSKCLKSVENTNGVTNRFLWACARRSKSLPLGGAVRDEDIAAIAQRIDCAVGWTQSRQEAIDFDSEANELWHTVYDELGEVPSGVVGAVMSRAEPHVRRLATIYAAMDRSPTISQNHLLAALEVWRYSADSVKWIFDAGSGSAKQDKLRDRILAEIKGAAEIGVSRGYLRARFGGDVKKSDVEFHLSYLLNSGIIRCQQEKRTRQSCEYYYPV